MSSNTAWIDKIYVFRVSPAEAQRVGSAFDPTTGRRRSHGLGLVGEPLAPYLGDRAEGYDLRLRKDDFNSVVVIEVLTDREPDKRGKYPTRLLLSDQEREAIAPDFFAEAPR